MAESSSRLAQLALFQTRLADEISAIGNMLSMITSLVTSLAILMVSAATTASCLDKRVEDAWTLQLEIRGGFGGAGTGSVLLISSDGKVKTQPRTPGAQTARICDTKLSAEVLRRLSDAIRRSQSVEWRVTELNFAASDATEYKMLLRSTIGGKEQVRA